MAIDIVARAMAKKAFDSDGSSFLNKPILDKFTEDMDGKLLYNNEPIVSEAQSEDTLELLELNKVYDSLLIREDWYNVPIYFLSQSFSISLFDQSGDNGIEFNENIDVNTNLPMIVLNIYKNGNKYSYFHSIFSTSLFDYNIGWYDINNNTCEAPELLNFNFYQLNINNNSYIDLSLLSAEEQTILDYFSRVVNTSVENMGGLGLKDDVIERFTGKLLINRYYSFSTTNSFSLSFPTNISNVKRNVVKFDLKCEQDITLTLPREKLLDNNINPNTTAGFHTLTFTYIPSANKWTINSINHIVPQYWDDIPDEVTPFGDCTWAQIKSIATHGYKNNLGQWCIRRNNVEEVWFEIGDEKTITLSGGETWVLQIWDFNHDDLADGSGKAPFTIGMKGATATSYKMNTTDTNAGGWEVCYFRTQTLPGILATLPAALQSVIAAVKKVSLAAQNTPVETSDTLWLPSTSEGYNHSGEGSKYAIFNTTNYNPGGGVSVWFRTIVTNNQRQFLAWYSSGALAGGNANSSASARLAFCI